jgi:hypothetical protein
MNIFQEMADNAGIDHLYVNANPGLRTDNDKRVNGTHKEPNKPQSFPLLSTTNDAGINEMDDGVDDLYVNESFIDIPIDRLESVIAEKRRNDNDAFRKEYAVGFITFVYLLI